MKIKKIVDICKRAGRMILLNDDKHQWLGDGTAFYPMVDAPLFDKESLYATFDITEKQQEEILFQFETALPENFCFANMCNNEDFADKNDISITYKGDEYLVYHSPGGALCIKAKYLKPLNKENLEIYQRQTENGIPYFACKTGYMIQAVIMPIRLSDNKEFRNSLDLLYEQSIREGQVQSNA